ncbi:guanine nucleotide exchange factor DBS-like isoform X2 [Macrobrachium rosenbergii]|uniref:guanine nucleotide exchange factor DBS-like isoform X2 n=1 Tax=Macrobrachium rosenbergii TaxID=79674 RepID=UPI0034D7B4A7
MSRLLWQLLEWLVPDRASGSSSPTSSPPHQHFYHHYYFSQRRGRRDPSDPDDETPKGTQSLISSPERGYRRQVVDPPDARLRRSVSCISDRYPSCLSHRDLETPPPEATPPGDIGYVEPCQDITVVVDPPIAGQQTASSDQKTDDNLVNEQETHDDDRKDDNEAVDDNDTRPPDGDDGKHGSESKIDIPKAIMASSRRRSLPANSGENGSSSSTSRFSFHRRFSMQGARRTAAARRRFHLPYNDIIRTEGVKIQHNGIEEEDVGVAEGAAKALKGDEYSSRRRRRGAPPLKERPTKTLSDYSLHLEGKSPDTESGAGGGHFPKSSHVDYDPCRSYVDMTSSLLTLDAHTIYNGDCSDELATPATASSSGDEAAGGGGGVLGASGVATGFYHRPPHESVVAGRDDQVGVSASTLSRSGDDTTFSFLPSTSSAALPSVHLPMSGGLHASSSLRSNLKHKGQIRRKRSDSGHSVTFDLPEDCDNLGVSREIQQRCRDDAEPLTKCMKEQTNRSKLCEVKPVNLSGAVNGEGNYLENLCSVHSRRENSALVTKGGEGGEIGEVCNGLDYGITEAEAPGKRAFYVESAGPNPPLSINSTVCHEDDEGDPSWLRDEAHVHHQTFTWHPPHLHLSDDDLDNDSDIRNEFSGFHPTSRKYSSRQGSEEVLSRDEGSREDIPSATCQGGPDSNDKNVIPYLTLPPATPPQPPSPIPPQLLASLAWSSGDSEGSPGSSTREPDSGYWGTGEGGTVVAGKKGVKVVTNGREYNLPYAYLHQGRLRLRIVRDEVLEEGGCALSVRDVSELLHAQYAIITGGKSREGCPILTFPDRGNFAQLGDEEYRKLIIYLTSVPSLQDADMGFVLVIDRRNDKWNSVKTVLLKISGFFPGLITVAYVLRPAGFLQKAISEVSNKIFRDEFKFRVVVCNCVGDLHDYIDRNQLTEDLDGCIPYNHDEWIEQRVRDRERGRRVVNRNPRRLFTFMEETALAHARTVMELIDDIASSYSDDFVTGDYILQIQIQHAVATLKQAVEKFSANTQEISASLRAFTQKLQETEFPNDVTSTEELLNSQCAEYSVLKDDLLSASRHGETLLNCIKRPGEPRTARLCPDKLINVTAVERLLVQLEETERTFDEFWTRHEGRLTQCLQLRRFETDFRELQTCLEESLKQLSGMSEVGDSVAHVDQLLAEAQDFHMMCADQLEKAEELRIIGMQLIESQHYAVDSIQPKCVELVRMRDAFHDRITTRLETLHKCRDLQERIERANKWCTEGVELLASQQIERCQAPEFAEEALRELEEFMASSDHSRLGSSHELRSIFEEFITPETKGLVQQVLKRIEDVQMMCEKRKSSLKKLATRLPRPVHAVTPEPAVPLHYPQGHSNVHPHSHPASPLHADLPKSPKSMRKASTLPKLGDSSDSPDWVGDAEAARAKRGHVLKELLDTERVYVSELCSILKGYKDEMLNPEMQPLIPVNLYGKSDLLFGNMEEIFRFHNDVFLRDLENCINTPELIGLCFVQRKDSFHRLYSLYCQNKPQSEELRRQVGDHNPFFKECQRRLHHKLPLGAYLLKPVQRITKYQLLLKDLLKCVEGSQGRRELQEAVDTMLTVLKCLNDSMHQVAITGFPGNLADLGKLLMQGPFSVWNESKKGLRELRLKPAQRHIFLYEKVLLFTKRAGKDTDRATYHFKNALKMSQVGLTESIRGHKGDIRKFEVWLQGRQEVHIILAPSVEVKEAWVKEIKRVLLDQFEYLKGENIKQYSSRIQKGASLNGIRIPPLSPTTQHRALRQTASWDMAGNGMSGSGGSISSSSSEGRTGESGKENSRRSMRGMKSAEGALDAPEEEEESWSSDYSASDEEEDQETFSESTEYTSSRFLVLADYNAMGGSEVSLREGDYVDLIKVGCAGWWYVRVSGTPYEGWAPAAYLERVLKKGSRSSPSVSSQESSSGLKHATSRSSVASLSAKSEEVNIL